MDIAGKEPWARPYLHSAAMTPRGPPDPATDAVFRALAVPNVVVSPPARRSSGVREPRVRGDGIPQRVFRAVVGDSGVLGDDAARGRTLADIVFMQVENCKGKGLTRAQVPKMLEVLAGKTEGMGAAEVAVRLIAAATERGAESSFADSAAGEQSEGRGVLGMTRREIARKTLTPSRAKESAARVEPVSVDESESETRGDAVFVQYALFDEAFAGQPVQDLIDRLHVDLYKDVFARYATLDAYTERRSLTLRMFNKLMREARIFPALTSHGLKLGLQLCLGESPALAPARTNRSPLTLHGSVNRRSTWGGGGLATAADPAFCEQRMEFELFCKCFAFGAFHALGGGHWLSMATNRKRVLPELKAGDIIEDIIDSFEEGYNRAKTAAFHDDTRLTSSTRDAHSTSPRSLRSLAKVDGGSRNDFSDESPRSPSLTEFHSPILGSDAGFRTASPTTAFKTAATRFGGTASSLFDSARQSSVHAPPSQRRLQFGDGDSDEDRTVGDGDLRGGAAIQSMNGDEEEDDDTFDSSQYGDLSDLSARESFARLLSCHEKRLTKIMYRSPNQEVEADSRRVRGSTSLRLFGDEDAELDALSDDEVLWQTPSRASVRVSAEDDDLRAKDTPSSESLHSIGLEKLNIQASRGDACRTVDVFAGNSLGRQSVGSTVPSHEDDSILTQVTPGSRQSRKRCPERKSRVPQSPAGAISRTVRANKNFYATGRGVHVDVEGTPVTMQSYVLPKITTAAASEGCEVGPEQLLQALRETQRTCQLLANNYAAAQREHKLLRRILGALAFTVLLIGILFGCLGAWDNKMSHELLHGVPI